jgi:hypothetical protein
VEFVTLGAPIPRGWLQRCIIDSHAAWREHLPRSVDPAHLTGRLVPDTAGSFSDIGFGTGVVLVELEEAHKNLGFVGELVETRATLLTMEERVRALEQDRADAEQRFDTKLAKALAMERDAQKRITRRNRRPASVAGRESQDSASPRRDASTSRQDASTSRLHQEGP